MISKPPSCRCHLCRPFLRCRRNDPCHIFHISHCRRRSPRGRYTQGAKCVKVMLSYKNKILSHFFHLPLIATFPAIAAFSTFPAFATFFTCSAFSADSAAVRRNSAIRYRIYCDFMPLYIGSNGLQAVSSNITQPKRTDRRTCVGPFPFLPFRVVEVIRSYPHLRPARALPPRSVRWP